MSKEPDWALYRTLLTVIETGSLSAAARQLGLAQPTVARHIDTLEETLGADLFLRSQRGLDPTELARAIEPQARTMAMNAAALLRTASGRPGEVAGTVRISASDVVGVEHLPAILSRLRHAHPGLAIELSLSDELDDLLGRASDIAVRMVEPTQSALLARRLKPAELGFHAHREYLAARGTPTSLAAFDRHDIIGYDRETPALRALAATLPALDRRAFALRTDSNIAQLAAIRAGLGIGICQVSVARRDDRIVRVVPEVGLTLPLWIVMHEDLKSASRYRAVFDALVEGLGHL